MIWQIYKIDLFQKTLYSTMLKKKQTTSNSCTVPTERKLTLTKQQFFPILIEIILWKKKLIFEPYLKLRRRIMWNWRVQSSIPPQRRQSRPMIWWLLTTTRQVLSCLLGKNMKKQTKSLNFPRGIITFWN